MEDLAQSIGDRIRILRKQKRFSREELAFQASLHSSYLGKVERGEKNIRLESLVRITQVLGVSLEEFFSVIDPAISNKSKPFTEIIKLLNSRSSKDHEKLLKVITTFLEMVDENR